MRSRRWGARCTARKTVGTGKRETMRPRCGRCSMRAPRRRKSPTIWKPARRSARFSGNTKTTTPRSTSVKGSEGTAMNVTLPADLRKQVEQELASGHYQSRDELIEQAVRHFLEERQRGQQRLAALRRIGQAVDQAGLYDRVLVPDQE